VLYAVKANFNPDLIRILASEGVDFDCVSPAEVEHLRATLPELDDSRILLTLNFAPRAEYEWAAEQGLQLTLDNLYPLQAWPEIFDGQKLFVRMDPGQGYGHHEHVNTAGVQSKFGIPLIEIDDLERLIRKVNATVIGIHAHSGSGILDPAAWQTVARELVAVAERCPDAEILDLGGGFGVPEKADDPAFDLAALDALLSAFKIEHPGYKLWLEPGRYLVATAGVLLTRVTQTKGKGSKRYIGVGAGMNSFIRPALYGAYHDIVNLSRYDEPATLSATVVGPICETGDKFGTDRLLPDCQENDVMMITNVGAYGYVMSSRYNLREVAPEIVLDEANS
jgi:diaminopimelate decarboxylase/aspartate kinase